MQWPIITRGGVPIYWQIANQMKYRVVSDRSRRGEISGIGSMVFEDFIMKRIGCHHISRLAGWAGIFSPAFLSVSLLAFSICILRADDASSGSEPPEVSFESFLEKPPIITSLAYNVSLGHSALSQIPNVLVERISNLSHKLKWDGTNYVMFTQYSGHKQYAGEFNRIWWAGDEISTDAGETIPIEIIDPRINPPGFSQGAIANAESQIHVGVSLGLPDMDLGSLVWDKRGHRCTASFHQPHQLFAKEGRTFDALGHNITLAGHGHMINKDTGKEIDHQDQGMATVDFAYENGVPVNAMVHGEGENFPPFDYKITYKYSPDFCHGRLPVEYTHANFTVHYLELVLAPEPIPITEFEPAHVLKDKLGGQVTYSNGVAWSPDDSSNLVKLPTAEELAGLGKPNKHVVVFWAVSLILLLSSVVYWICARRKCSAAP